VTVLQSGDGEGLDNLISVAEAFEKSQQPDFNDIASPLIDGTDTERLLVKVCVLCGKALLGRNALGRHMKNAHPKVFGPYPCPQEGCHKLLESGAKVVSHMTLHSAGDKAGLSPEVKPLKCSQCEFMGSTPGRLCDHMRKAHAKIIGDELAVLAPIKPVTRLVCNAEDNAQCRESFATALQFIRHMRNDHNLPPWRCEVCARRFQDRQNYRFHIMSHEKFKKNFTCDICSKSYNNPRQLYSHRSLHLGKSETCSKKHLCGPQLCEQYHWFSRNACLMFIFLVNE
jgi:hypothetical protein